MSPIRYRRVLTLSLLVLLCAVGVAAGQVPQEAMSGQTLRPYLHVFAAYAVAWLLIGGWIISIHRRLGRLERSGD